MQTSESNENCTRTSKEPTKLKHPSSRALQLFVLKNRKQKLKILLCSL